MDKSIQEEIRENVAIKVFDWDYEGINTWAQNCIGRGAYYDLADKILKYLDSKGAVIKVDRELPEYHRGKEATCGESCHFWEQQNMLESGYVATERMVE